MANITPAKGYILVKWLPENDQPESMQNGDGSVTIPTPASVDYEKPLCQFEVMSGPKVGQIALANSYAVNNPLPGLDDVYFISEDSILGYSDAPIDMSNVQMSEVEDA